MLFLTRYQAHQSPVYKMCSVKLYEHSQVEDVAITYVKKNSQATPASLQEHGKLQGVTP